MKLLKSFTQVFLRLFAVYLLAVFSVAGAVTLYFKSISSREYEVEDIMVEIPYGSSLRRVSHILQTASVIDDAVQFYWYVRLGRDDSDKIQAGYYHFNGSINKEQIADRLLFGQDRSTLVTFKEGETLVDLANQLESLGLVAKSDFIAAMRSDEILRMIDAPPNAVARLNLENDTGGLEGYLFPDTYFFSERLSAVDIIKRMHGRLREILDDKMMERVEESGRSLHEILTLASIIEKETGDPKERAIIASVYHNRLEKRMRLQADPTVIYGIKNYDGKIRKVDLLTYHPYNTYKIDGLPPGPIAAPGAEAIHAALWPADTNYLYFVSKNNGSHIFCEDLACHNEAVRIWQIEFFKKTATH